MHVCSVDSAWLARVLVHIVYGKWSFSLSLSLSRPHTRKHTHITHTHAHTHTNTHNTDGYALTSTYTCTPTLTLTHTHDTDTHAHALAHKKFLFNGLVESKVKDTEQKAILCLINQSWPCLHSCFLQAVLRK